MPYIIDQANMIKNGQLQRCSIVVDGNRIDYISQQTKAYRWIRMPVNEFLLTPGYIMLDFSFQTPRSFPEFKEYMQQHFLSKGCTSLLAVCDVLYEQQLPNALQKLQQSLLNSPIDYFIGAKIPFRLLTPSFIRACKRWKVPVLFVELQGEERLEEAPWSWMYEAFVSYPVTLVPYWITQDATKRLQMRWKELLSSYRIPFIPFALQERTPLSLDVLKKIGVYPHKGDVRIGGEVDYNLYARTLLSDSVAETAIVDYDKHIPMITVHNGRIMRAGNHLFFYPGFGKERTIRVPGMFAADF